MLSAGRPSRGNMRRDAWGHQRCLPPVLGSSPGPDVVHLCSNLLWWIYDFNGRVLRAFLLVSNILYWVHLSVFLLPSLEISWPQPVFPLPGTVYCVLISGTIFLTYSTVSSLRTRSLVPPMIATSFRYEVSLNSSYHQWLQRGPRTAHYHCVFEEHTLDQRWSQNSILKLFHWLISVVICNWYSRLINDRCVGS